MDIDETIIESTTKIEFATQYLFDQDIDSLSVSTKQNDIYMDLFVSSTFQIMHTYNPINQYSYVSLIRPNFFEMLLYAINNDISVILYTMGNVPYANQMKTGIIHLFKNWLIYSKESIDISKMAKPFDMVIGSCHNGKTLGLINDYVPLTQFKKVIVLDDLYHSVKCFLFCFSYN